MKWLLEYLTQRMNDAPSASAILEKGHEISRSSLLSATNNIVRYLAQSGIQPGGRVCICLENTADFVVAYLGVAAYGCWPVLLDPASPVSKAKYVIQDSGVHGFLGTQKLFDLLYKENCSFDSVLVVEQPGKWYAWQQESIPFQVWHKTDDSENSLLVLPFFQKEKGIDSRNEMGTIIYTSGSTGKPKGVVLSSESLKWSVSIIHDMLNLTERDVVLVTMSFCHCAGLLHLLAHLIVGAQVVTGETATMIGPFLGALKKYAVTVLPGVPSFFIVLLRHGKYKIQPYLQTIRIIELSSSFASTFLIREIKDLLPQSSIYNTYGLTEVPRLTYHKVSCENDDILSVGKANKGVNLKILDSNLQSCPPYTPGEIFASGVNIAQGYLNGDTLSASERFTDYGFRTGDVGYLDSDGRLFLKGRIDDMIKIGAERVYPQEIEEALLSHPLIRDALAYEAKDDIYGSIIMAKVVTISSELTPDDIVEHCRIYLEKYKIPKKIEICESIELNDSGKPQRNRVSRA